MLHSRNKKGKLLPLTVAYLFIALHIYWVFIINGTSYKIWVSWKSISWSQAHPWLVDSEKEQLCRLMNCQKLSLEACTHAAQNERLPLRVIVQVLFFEQLRLRASVAGWFFVSDNIENSHVPIENLPLFRNNATSQSNRANYQKEDQVVGIDDMRHRVLELEKECSNMNREIEKMEKSKSGGWNILSKLGFKRSQASNPKTSKPNSSNAPPHTWKMRTRSWKQRVDWLNLTKIFKLTKNALLLSIFDVPLLLSKNVRYISR